MNFKQILFLAFIFLLPIDGSEYLSFYVGPVHTSILDLMLIVMLYMVFLEGALKGFNVKPFGHIIFYLLMMVFTLSTVSLLYIPGDSLAYDIKTTVNFLEFLSIIFVAMYIINDIAFLKKVLLLFFVSTLIISVFTLLKSSGAPVPGAFRGSPVPIGPFSLNALGLIDDVATYAFMVLGIFPFLLRTVLIKSIIVKVLSALLIVVAVVIVYSRGLWTALLVEVIVTLLAFLVLKRNIINKTVIAGALAVFLAVVIFYSGEISAIVVGLRPTTVADRIEGYLLILSIIFSNPLYFLFGAGVGNFLEYSGGIMPHNFVLELLIGKGFIVTLIYLLFLFLVMAKLFKITKKYSQDGPSQNSVYATLFFVVMVGMLTEGQSVPPINSIVCWTEFAIICSFITLVDKGMDSKTVSYKGYI